MKNSPSIPEWFALPTSEVVRQPTRSMFSNEYKWPLARVLDMLLDGELVLPPWQRPLVWTQAQQIKLFDSLIRGVSIGAITLWHPPFGSDFETRCFPECPKSAQAQFVIDGQQRLSTLLAASRGDLDHFRWDGQTWQTGSGFLVPSQVVRRDHYQLFGWLREVTQEQPQIRRCLREAETVSEHEITFMTLDGSFEHMLKTYERLATCGVPHSVEDLEVMRQWVSPNDK